MRLVSVIPASSCSLLDRAFHVNFLSLSTHGTPLRFLNWRSMIARLLDDGTPTELFPERLCIFHCAQLHARLISCAFEAFIKLRFLRIEWEVNLSGEAKCLIYYRPSDLTESGTKKEELDTSNCGIPKTVGLYTIMQ